MLAPQSSCSGRSLLRCAFQVSFPQYQHLNFSRWKGIMGTEEIKYVEWSFRMIK